MKLFSKNKRDRQPRQYKGLYIILSFFLPFTIMVLALAWLKVTPFGDKTLLISDSNGLYLNYSAYFGRLVKGLEGFTYSFEKGLGGNMMPHMGVTMLNPFTSLFSLFSIRDYPIAYTLDSVLNLSLCGLTMYLLLADIHGHKRSNLFFSTAYALMGFNVANVFQILFFTAVHTLPLVVLGLRKLLKGKSPLLYILSLCYALVTSYYMGFMICVASVLLFFLYLWLYSVKLKGKKGKLYLRYALSSLCGGLLAAAVWLPALLGIVGGRLEQTKITDFSFAENMPLPEIGAKLFTGANNVYELVNGLPNIFVGILPLALVVLFFMNKTVAKRNKIAAGVALGFYILAFYITAINMLMHGGTTTNWFNYRYSYIFSFLLLLIAAEEWELLDTVSIADCKKCGVILVLAVLIVFSKRYSFVIGGEIVLDFALLLVMFLAFYMHRKDAQKNTRRAFQLIILFVTCFQLTLNYYISTKQLVDEDSVWSQKVPEYRETVDLVSPLVDALTTNDQSFFRMEVNKQRSGNCGNDSMLYGYNGVGHGGSVERNFVRTGLNKLGVHRYDMRSYYQEGIPAATDTLLGLKYIIAQEDLTTEKHYQNATNYDDIEYFQDQDNYDIFYNADALPVAFLSQSQVENVETDFANVFDNLNRTWAAISGVEQPVFVEESDIDFSAYNLFDDLTITADNARTLIEKYDAEAEAAKESASDSVTHNKTEENKSEPPEFSAYIKYSWTAKRDGAIYTYNRGSMTEESGNQTPVLEYQGYYHKGDTVTGYIPVVSDYVNRVGFEEICGRFHAVYADLEALHASSEAIRARPCTIVKPKESKLYGEFNADAKQKLLFTIPYDEGWTCLIDGKEAEINKVLDVFMAVDAPEGRHSYEMRFMPSGMKIGMILSAIALLTTLCFILIDTLRKKKAAGSLDSKLNNTNMV